MNAQELHRIADEFLDGIAIDEFRSEPPAFLLVSARRARTSTKKGKSQTND